LLSLYSHTVIFQYAIEVPLQAMSLQMKIHFVKCPYVLYVLWRHFLFSLNSHRVIFQYVIEVPLKAMFLRMKRHFVKCPCVLLRQLVIAQYYVSILNMQKKYIAKV
jgi:ABC-type histidine transport system ATPase subunit